MNEHLNQNLEEEAIAFDEQINERIANGHIPDLRLTKPCDYFYNNSWRRPEFVKLDFIEQFELIKSWINNLLTSEHASSSEKLKVLEVGCGPGYLSLELARSGFDVVGIDVSQRCIDIAIDTAKNDPWIKERGDLTYFKGDFFSHSDLISNNFDAIVFLGSLHHFSDQEKTQNRANDLLKKDGLILVHEPVRDQITKGHAAFALLISTLFSLNGNFYKEVSLIEDGYEIQEEIERLFKKLRYELEDGTNLQSINDNTAGHAKMYPVLKNIFQEEHFEWRYAFFHEFIGGLRYDEETNKKLAIFLKEIDSVLVKTGVLSATEFFFVGRKI